MGTALVGGTATAIGSLPHTDPVQAAAFVLDHLVDLPAAPQLPNRTPAASMVAQWLHGLAGVEIAGDGSLLVDPARLDPASTVAVDLDHPGHAGRDELLDALASGQAGVDGDAGTSVKVQLTGPLTLGLALAHAGAPRDEAFRIAQRLATAGAAALTERVRRRLGPAAEVVVFLDEPGLVASAHPGASPTGAAVTELLAPPLAAIVAGGAVGGVHCCAAVDWDPVVDVGPLVLSLPAWPLPPAGALGRHLEGGGWLAWGVVPTRGPLGLAGSRYWRRLNRAWTELAGDGIDFGLLQSRALVTPECGLAGHTVAQAGRILDIVGRIGRRVAVGGGAPTARR